MVATPNLQITHLEANSDQPEVPVDAAMDGFDAAITAVVAFPVTSSNALAVTQAQLAACFTLQLNDSGSTNLITVTITAFARGDFVVYNNTAHAADIKIAGQAGTIPRVPAVKKRRLHSDGVNISDLGDDPYTVATLPANPVARQREWVSDAAAAPVFSAAPTGGGALLVPVYYDGTTWRYG